MQLRHQIFDEVRWVDGNEDLCMSGLADLHARLVTKVQYHTLLLIDDPAIYNSSLVQSLLLLPDVHIVVATALDPPAKGADACAGPPSAGSGRLKRIYFPLGPLDPVQQAQLFLRRATRPLYLFEFLEQRGAPSSEAEPVILQPRRAAEFIALADTPLLSKLGGNPARIISASQRLSKEKPCFASAGGTLDARVDGGDVSAGGDSLLKRSNDSDSSQEYCRVQLVRPDGNSKHEWLPRPMRIADVIAQFCPRKLHGCADIFISGCRAQPSACLADFSGIGGTVVLVLEFRARVVEEAW